MESTLHKHLKTQALYWLRNKMIDLCANEVKLYVKRKKFQADALGINIKRKESRIIEVKVTRADFLRDDVLSSSYGYHALADYAYIMTPVGLLASEELPKGYGLLEVDEYDMVTVRRKPLRNQKPMLTLDTLIKRTGRAATNATVYKDFTKETKDQTDGAFSKEAKVSLISATCPKCKKRNKYLVRINEEYIRCSVKKCGDTIPLKRARVHQITAYNEAFLTELQTLMEKK